MCATLAMVKESALAEPDLSVVVVVVVVVVYFLTKQVADESDRERFAQRAVQVE